MEATIFDTSPKEALGFWPLMAAWVSLKNSAYADTGFCGSFGSFFFLPFFAVVVSGAGATAAGFPPLLRAAAGWAEDGRTGWKDIWESRGDEDRDMGASTKTLLCVERDREEGQNTLASQSLKTRCHENPIFGVFHMSLWHLADDGGHV